MYKMSKIKESWADKVLSHRRNLLKCGLGLTVFSSLLLRKCYSLPETSDKVDVRDISLLQFVYDSDEVRVVVPSGLFLLDESWYSKVGRFDRKFHRVVISGAGRNTSVLKLSPSSSLALSFSEQQAVVIEDLTLDCREQVKGSGIQLIRCDNVRLKGLRILNSYNNGILIDRDCKNVFMEDVLIKCPRNEDKRPSGGHGIALSGDNRDAAGERVSNFKIRTVDITDPYGSGINVSEATKGEIADVVVRSGIARAKHVSGYGAVRFTNRASEISVKGVLSIGMSRGIVLSEAAKVTIVQCTLINSGMEAVLITGDKFASRECSLHRIIIVEADKLRQKKDAVRIAYAQDIYLDDFNIISRCGVFNTDIVINDFAAATTQIGTVKTSGQILRKSAIGAEPR